MMMLIELSWTRVRPLDWKKRIILQQKEAWLEFLKETTWLTRSSRWSEVKEKLRDSEAYKQCESSTSREDWFRDYVRTLPEVFYFDFLSPLVICEVYKSLLILILNYMLFSWIYNLIIVLKFTGREEGGREQGRKER